ncbi:MAG: hypothetical protein ACQEXJ_01495 [Myxococcota bacterium]
MGIRVGVSGVVVVALALTLGPTSDASARRGSGVVRPADDTAEAVLKRAFRAALSDDFEAYLETVHPAKRQNAMQRDAIERYEWSRFREQASWYLTSEDPPEFEVARRTGDGEERVRLFVKDQDHSDRMPVPVRFEKRRGHWYIVANSL